MCATKVKGQNDPQQTQAYQTLLGKSDNGESPFSIELRRKAKLHKHMCVIV